MRLSFEVVLQTCEISSYLGKKFRKTFFTFLSLLTRSKDLGVDFVLLKTLALQTRNASEEIDELFRANLQPRYSKFVVANPKSPRRRARFTYL